MTFYDGVNGTLQHVPVDISDSATIVSAPSGRGLSILSFCLNAAADVSLDVVDTDDGALIGTMTLVAGETLELNHNPMGWARTPASKGIKLTLGSSVQVGGSIVTVEV